jgi:WD40 repeat protein
MGKNKIRKANKTIVSIDNNYNLNIQSIVFANDGRAIAVMFCGNNLKTFYIDSGKNICDMKFVGFRMSAFSPNSELVALNNNDYLNIELRYTYLQKHIRNIYTCYSPLLYDVFGFSFDNKSIAVNDSDRDSRNIEFKIMDCMSGDLVREIYFGENVFFVKFVFNNAVFVYNQYNDINVLIFSTNETIKLTGHNHYCNDIKFSHNEKFLASASNDRTVKIWGGHNYSECIHTLIGHNKKVLTIAFSPDNKFIASGSYDKSIKIWDLKTGKCIRTLINNNFVLTLEYSPDGTKIAAGIFSGRVNIWDL